MGTTTPSRLDDISADWLTSAMRAEGAIADDAEISSFTRTDLGDGEGFVGDIARLTLDYGAGTGPASVIAKVPTAVDLNRATGKSLGVYEREVRAYDTLLASVDVPQPATHVAIYEANGDEEAFLERMIKAERLPLFLLRPLLRKVQTDADVPPCILLMEDLADAEMGDQVAGCDAARAEVALRVAARMHASAWGAACPPVRHWFQNGDVVPRLFHAQYKNNRRSFEAFAAARMSEHGMAHVHGIRKSGLARITRLHEQTPRTLLHGDYRLDNLFFGPDGGLVAVIDWQTTNRGPAVLDVGYFIGGSLAPDTPESVIDELLAAYHEELVANGVGDYPLDRLLADYEEGLLLLLHRMSGLDQLDVGDDRGVELMDAWFSRLDARLQRVPV
ncbi:MAG: phosphotransferase [Actinomycetota bacterium]